MADCGRKSNLTHCLFTFYMDKCQAKAKIIAFAILAYIKEYVSCQNCVFERHRMVENGDKYLKNSAKSCTDADDQMNERERRFN